MTLPFIAAALSLAEFAPSIIRLISGDKKADSAQEILNRAKKIAQTEDVLEISQIFRENPQMLLDFQHSIFEIEKECELAYLGDRKDARERDSHFIKLGHRNYRGDIMVVSAALGLISCLFTLTYFSNNLPGETVGILSTIAGIFGSCLKDAYAFEFGSSRGSKEKDSTVAVLLGKDRN